MQVNKQEYEMIIHAIEELEKLKSMAEREFDDYCANIMHCTDCPLYGIDFGCTADNYFNLKDKGEI